MLELRNRTPFAAAIAPGLDREGRDTVTVLVKGTFALSARGRDLSVAEEQVKVAFADTFHGEPGRSSVKYEADGCPGKRGTDVVLVGHACSLRPVPSLDVELFAGRLKKVVRVFGDRVWHKSVGAWALTKPAPFTRMPLVYERAFGGVDATNPQNAAREQRNPLGAGFAVADNPARIEGLLAPNLEDPDNLIVAPTDMPPPAGFGFVSRNWFPRSSFAGTYDERWRSERMPFLPDDFDDRYFNGASAGLASPAPFTGGEAVRVTNVSEVGEIAFRVPSQSLEVAVAIKGAISRAAPVLDTLLIDPDERRVVITWRRTMPCPRTFLFIDHVRITRKEAA
jgi:hypothetical protein